MMIDMTLCDFTGISYKMVISIHLGGGGSSGSKNYVPIYVQYDLCLILSIKRALNLMNNFEDFNELPLNV